MKRIKSLDLLEQLQNDVRKIIMTIHLLQREDPAILLQQPAAGKWSAIQAIEHLNSYGRYYLPAIEKAMQQNASPAEWYKAGWLGNYFTNMMLPKEGMVNNKMQSPKDHRPPQQLDVKPVLEEFLQQQQTILNLLDKARTKNISSLRVPISLAKMVKLKLGDTFRFVIAHEQRHMVQANMAIEKQRLQRTPDVIN